MFRLHLRSWKLTLFALCSSPLTTGRQKTFRRTHRHFPPAQVRCCPLSVYSIVSLVTTCCFCKIDVRLLLLALCFHDSLESTQSGGLLPLFAPVLTFGFFLHNVRCVSVMTVVIDLDCLLLNPQLRVRTNAPQRSALKSPGGLRTMARMDEVVAIAASRVSLVSCPIWRSRFAMQVEFSSQERSRPS